MLELKLEALEARVAAAAIVNDWHALLQPVFALLTKTLDAGLDKDFLIELLDGLETLSGRVAEGPANVASSLDCVRKTLEMLWHFEADLTTHDLITLHKVDLAIDALASDAADLCQ
ncbi:hypothetical protein SDRG_04316 [Saprolegnia diclina VS20]|uniref:Uncharacterized protein n=1 Tax=Saprolegnia diclina (strain VS20) TaxID=1156394 RepID=T0QX47_SAPDV|nr:hypothetical protein SDRG_04316 [Saprolegnia diclina VS20]EQC38615.1 hypothetical protein SDRG_04316 [Saprolegnia diclina VS20]|eukprot:XP_008608207.1 hypothetical protein SDRG_04316 [Saprolegnia diclina VS20]